MHAPERETDVSVCACVCVFTVLEPLVCDGSETAKALVVPTYTMSIFQNSKHFFILAQPPPFIQQVLV